MNKEVTRYKAFNDMASKELVFETPEALVAAMNWPIAVLHDLTDLEVGCTITRGDWTILKSTD